MVRYQRQTRASLTAAAATGPRANETRKAQTRRRRESALSSREAVTLASRKDKEQASELPLKCRLRSRARLAGAAAAVRRPRALAFALPLRARAVAPALAVSHSRRRSWRMRARSVPDIERHNCSTRRARPRCGLLGLVHRSAPPAAQLSQVGTRALRPSPLVARLSSARRHLEPPVGRPTGAHPPRPQPPPPSPIGAAPPSGPPVPRRPLG